ncbi:11095_t:CDS:2 [Dentiscutata heterogama]|uniref:11095_t:CDS:1 n=1 Tax=Dentiscutata heterogama TaxID=1316150 RepID=A0ACA9L8L8_9GLOM|nr:11095_t:CDS:2 [Dentiscutata heterogama]
MRLQYEYRYNELVTLDMSLFEQFIRDARAFVHEVDFKCEFVFQNYKNMLKVLDLSLPKASVDTLYFDPDNHPISKNFLIERWIYINTNCLESLGEYLIMVKESHFASICSPQKFFQIRHNFNWNMSSLIELSNYMLEILIASLVVNYLENLLLKFPIIRTFIKLSKLHTNFGFTGFADLNFLYWTMFGRSSLELSALVPRDPAANKKAIMYLIYNKLFGGFDIPDYPILPFLKPVMTKFVQLINLCWLIMADFDLNAIYKIKPFFDNKSFSETWAPLDHSDSIEKVLEELKKGKIPVVTAKTGAGKIKSHTSSAPKLFARTRDNIDENNLNVCTHGWLQVTNHLFKDKDFLIIIDEFHEMDEDSLILLERYKGNVILLSATPIPIPNSTTITAIFHYLNEYPKLKTLIIIPSLSQCIRVHNTIASSLSRKIQVVDAKNDEIKDDTEIIIGTSVWDAGHTWSGCQLVIDSGLSIGKVNGKFITRELSHAIEIQRADRTGRTNDEISLNPKIPSCYNALLSNPDIGIYLEILFSSQQSDADMLYRLLLGGHFNQNTYHFAKNPPTTPLEDIWIALNNYKINTGPFQQNMFRLDSKLHMFYYHFSKSSSYARYEYTMSANIKNKYPPAKKVANKPLSKRSVRALFATLNDEMDLQIKIIKGNAIEDSIITKKNKKKFKKIEKLKKKSNESLNKSYTESSKMPICRQTQNLLNNMDPLHVKNVTFSYDLDNSHCNSCITCNHNLTNANICCQCLPKYKPVKMPTSWYALDALNACHPHNTGLFKRWLYLSRLVTERDDDLVEMDKIIAYLTYRHCSYNINHTNPGNSGEVFQRQDGISPFQYNIRNDYLHWYATDDIHAEIVLGLYDKSCKRCRQEHENGLGMQCANRPDHRDTCCLSYKSNLVAHIKDNCIFETCCINTDT